MYKLVIFDVDGLLLDTESLWQQSWKKVGEDYGIKDLHTTTFLKCIGKSGNEAQEVVLNDLPKDIAIKILDDIRKYGNSLINQAITVKEGAYDLIDYLDQHQIKKAVATSTKKDTTKERLIKVHLYDRFDYILCGDEVKHRKPNPEIYLTVVEKFDFNKDQILVLEDSLVGVNAAINAGLDCIMVPDIVKETKTVDDKLLAIVPSLYEVRKYVK